MGSSFYESRSLCVLVSAVHLIFFFFFKLPTCDFYAIVFGRDFSRFDFCWDLGTSAMLNYVMTDSLTANVS